jgi:hypothetical protein
MTHENISSQIEPEAPILLNIGERMKHIQEPLQVPEDTGKSKKNSYIVYFHYGKEEIPFILPKVEYVEFSNRDDWIAATWRDLPFDVFRTKFNNTITKINDTTKLKYNWDSYGAERISVTTASKAINFLYESFRVLNNRGITLPKPFTAPCPDGSIQFEWEMEGKELEIIVPYDIEDKISFLQIKGDDYMEGIIDHPSQIVEFFL